MMGENKNEIYLLFFSFFFLHVTNIYLFIYVFIYLFIYFYLFIV